MFSIENAICVYDEAGLWLYLPNCGRNDLASWFDVIKINLGNWFDVQYVLRSDGISAIKWTGEIGDLLQKFDSKGCRDALKQHIYERGLQKLRTTHS